MTLKRMMSMFLKNPIKQQFINIDSTVALRSFCDALYKYLCEFQGRGYGCIAFVCIGTDRSTGDSLGPLIGYKISNLKYKNVFVHGTLENPVHAVNLRKTISQIKTQYRGYRVIAVDACLGTSQSIGCIQIKEGSIQPGRGVGKRLSHVGDCSIVGIVDEAVESDDYEYENYLRINNVRLGLVMKMSETIAKGIYSAFRQ
jgi:putative sporulation protein YyaC